MLPIRLFTSPQSLLGSFWNESERSRALLLGLPALVFAVVGVSVLLWAKFGVADSLEDRYLVQLEKSSKEKSRLKDELRLEERILQVTSPAGTEGTSGTDLIAKDDPRRKDLAVLRDQERVYLEKLIDLNPEESEYLYKLAQTALESDPPNVRRCLALMNAIAPIDEPGYIDAHLWQANYFMGARARTNQQAMQNIAFAMQHAENCLRRDQNNATALNIKARLLFAQKKDLNTAYEIYSQLFEDEPRAYGALVEINKTLSRTERNAAVLDSAIARFNQELEDESTFTDVAERTQVWRDLTTCYLEKKQYDIAEQKLLGEIERQSKMLEKSGSIWAKRLLANVYLKWAAAIQDEDLNADRERLEKYKKAFEYNPGNKMLLRQLTRLSVSEDAQVAEEAIRRYNGAVDPDAPSGVLNELGSQALSRKDYDGALRLFELARKKAPRDPEILNNLAYTYVVCDDSNPKRGLTLVDEALRNLPNTVDSRAYLTYFRDTRGQALMQLNRWTDAAAEFEKALVDRPDNTKILESIIECYKASGLDATAFVNRLQDANESKQ